MRLRTHMGIVTNLQLHRRRLQLLMDHMGKAIHLRLDLQARLTTIVAKVRTTIPEAQLRMDRYLVNRTSTPATPLPSYMALVMEARVKIKTILMECMEIQTLIRVLIVS